MTTSSTSSTVVFRHIRCRMFYIANSTECNRLNWIWEGIEDSFLHGPDRNPIPEILSVFYDDFGQQQQL